MTIVESLYQYFKACPLLGDNKINIDYLPEKNREYTIDTITCDPVIRKYIRGPALKQYLFAFGSREAYGSDALQNLANSGFYEQFAKWLDTQTKTKNFPSMELNQKPTRIEAQSSGYLFNSDTETARYQIQCWLVYYEN